MAPSPQEHSYNGIQLKTGSKPLCGEEIVISGMSGLFPKSNNVLEFMDNLYNKVDMVTPAFENFKHSEVPKHMGKIAGANKFDAQFFRVTHHQAVTLDPMTRKSMEHAYAAIYDAGENPLSNKGKKIGVYTGTEYNDAGFITIFCEVTRNPFVVTGSSPCMMSNRISYFLDSKGQSVSVNSGSASGMTCLEDAYNDIKSGVCEAALVGGCQSCVHHILSINLKNAGLLCLDGKTKCFDKNADGYVRSEAISFFYLQKAKNAKRIYAEVSFAKTIYGLKPDAQFLPIRKQEDITDFLKKFYSEAGVSPSEVEYVEAYGTALREGDVNELQAISEVFANENPVMVGCVKSNMGNSEAASAVCGIAKLCLAYHEGKLPGNLHYNEPLDISSIQKGRVKILEDNTPFNRGFTAINTFANTGTNCHALFKGHYKPKNLKCYDCTIPRLIFVSGRQNEGVEKIFNILKTQPIDPELIGLVHNIYQVDTPGHTYRGYTVIDTDDKKKTVSLSESVQLYQGSRRPLCLVFSGMGSQWAGMGRELMRIPIFAAAIEKCRTILEPKGIDIVRIITELDDTIFDNIINCFVGIAAMQIGLIDVLKAVDIVPDYFLGHSVGEMGCAYFDGGFTAEEMLLAAYYRGLVSVEVDFIKGSMAAIGLGYKDVFPTVPPSIDIACRNSSESCTISGPADRVKTFVEDLKSKGIFAKTVPTANIAYHSRYIKEAGPKFLAYLKEFISKPVPRSEKWISTSMPQEKWNEPIAKFSSPEYHTNNLLSPVYFEDAALLIPPDAVMVEVAPHGLLQAILKRSHPKCAHIPVTKRGHSDPVRFLLESFGKLYEEGFNPKIDVLYPKIEYPVSTETPMLSHFIEWYHCEEWPTSKDTEGVNIITPMRRFIMSVEDDDYQFIAGHLIDGDILFPEAAVLFLLWETLAMYNGVHHEVLSVAFRDIHFHGNVVIDPKKIMKLNFLITKGKRYFEVTRDNSLVASGYIEEILKPKYIRVDKDPSGEDDSIIMNTEDIYKVFREKGYDYKDEFQSIKTSSNKWSTAEIKWTGNWITFIDSLIQLNILARNHDGVSAVKLIKYMNINVNHHICNKKATDDAKLFVRLDLNGHITRCDGVEIQHIIFEDMPVKDQEPDVLLTMSFIPHCVSTQVDLREALQINLQLVAENSYENIINVLDVGTKFKLNDIIQSVSKYIPDVVFKVHTMQTEDVKSTSKINLIVAQNFLTDRVYDDIIYTNIEKNTFVLTFEKSDDGGIENNNAFNVITSIVVEGQKLVLLKKATNTSNANISFIPVTYDTKFLWVSRMQCELEKYRKVILVSEKDHLNGLLGLVKKLKEDFHDKIGLIILGDNQAPSWNPEKRIFKEQIKNNLVFNVLKQGQWGNYYYLPSRKSTLRAVTDFNLVSSVSGDIDSLQWTEAKSGANSKNVVKVCFAGPSLRDTQIAVGLVETDTKGFGMDFSGLDNKGNRVMGLVNSGALSSTVEADLDLLWPVPDNWTLEEAATVPLPYIQALYCLTMKCRLYSRHSVFVNGGAGALGQAVISVCLGIGCTVYTSVGDSHKKKFLMKLFPQLSEKNIGYSYDGSFLDTVIINSSKKKCDIVINCMSGPDRESAMKCVGSLGIFLDLSTYDIKENTDFGMSYLNRETSYAVVNLSTILKADNAHERKTLQRCLTEGIANGIVRPLSYVVFSAEDVPRAFRLLTTRKNRGRVLINIKESAKTLSVIPRMKLSSTSIYVIVCDDTQLGIVLANRLVKQGAKYITLHMKHKKTDGYYDSMLALWKNLNVTVSISTANLNTEKDCVKFLKKEQESGPVHGIFIIPGYSKTDSCEQEDFVENSNDIISIVTNLSLVSKNNCPELRYFVIIARTSQNTVDEYTTSVLEQICRKRAEINLPSLVFRAAISDKNQLAMSNTIMRPQTITVALNGLETSLNQKYNQVLAYNVKKGASEDFLMKITKIIGVGNVNDVDENLPLSAFAYNEIVIEELKHTIKENSGLELTAEDIGKMSMGRLLNLGIADTEKNTEFDSGMGAFYNFIDQDEIAATNVFKPIPTLCEFTEDEQYLDTNGTYLMLIPGFEGHHHIFKSICERLKIGAVALQLRPNVSDNSIEETAVDIKSQIVKKFSMKSKFYLLGYSYGVNVALEVAALFERDGLTGVVYCLDSSPDALRIQIDAYLGNPSENQLQNMIIAHLFNIISGQTSEQLIQELENIGEWSVKVDVCLKYLQKLVTYSFEYCKDLLEAAYKRITSARNYKPNFRLESELVLLKGIPHPKAVSLSSDYNLSKYTKKAVRVYEISSDVACATEDNKVANIVNRLLDPELLEKFKKRNLCVSYLNDSYKME